MNHISDKLISPGKWFVEFDENGSAVKAVYDQSYRSILGYETIEEYDRALDKWEHRIHPDDADRMAEYAMDVLSKHPEGKDYDIEYRLMTKYGYRWCHDYGHCTRREDGSVLRCDGVLFDIQEIKDHQLQEQHDRLLKEVLDYNVAHVEDPVEILGHFAEKLRILLDCDQVIYRDLEKTRFMVNSPAIEKDWVVPDSYCKQCPHYDAHHPMYKDGYTEMANCQEGWNGIPVYHKCPIKSSLTRIVYCNGEVAGYLAIHYVQKYHEFNHLERKTLEEIASNLTILLSRYETDRQLKEVQAQKENALIQHNQRIMALEDNFESLYDIELESGAYSITPKGDFFQTNVVNKLLEPGDFFKDLKQDVEAVIYPDDRDGLLNILDKNALRNALDKEERFEYYYRIMINDAPVWFKIRVVYKDAEKKNVVLGVFNAAQELEAKQIEEQRAQIAEQATFTNYFLNTYLSAYYIDLNTLECKVYKRTEELEKNYPVKNNYLTSLVDYINNDVNQEDREELLACITPERIRENLTEKQEFTHTFHATTRGEKRVLRMQLIWGADKDHAALGFKDVTEEVRKEKDQQQKLKKALETAKEEALRNDLLHDIIQSAKWSFKVSADDKVIGATFSNKLQELSGGIPDDNPMGWTDFINEEDKARATEEFMATIKDHTCQTPYDTTYRMTDKEGRHYWFHSAGRVIRHEDGTGEFFGMHVDITDQIEEKERQQKQLEDALNLAQTANQAKSTFLFNMSHDIRTPMNAITGFTMMAKKHADDKEMVLDYLNKIDLSGHQLLILVNKVLEMARIESGKVELVEQPVNIKDRFEAMVTILAEQAEVRGLKFHSVLEDVTHFHLLADDARMGQITLNVASNAMKYTPEGGRIDFKVKEIPCRKKGYATFVFVMSDTGIGMSEEFQKKLFEPFSRENNSTVSHIQGTGLGLSIVKSLVDLAKGKIKVHSEQGKGTRFEITITFKINNGDTQTTGVEYAEKLSKFVFKGKKALLVEDNELNREISRFILEDKGVEIEEAEDGDVAVKKIENIIKKGDYKHFDFILMDVQMPRMNGYEATAKIREMFEPLDIHIPIIAVSANAFEEDKKKSLEAGMDDHIAKPIEVAKLWTTLAKFI